MDIHGYGYPWISTENLWIWIWIWMWNLISTATLDFSSKIKLVFERRVLFLCTCFIVLAFGKLNDWLKMTDWLNVRKNCGIGSIWNGRTLAPQPRHRQPHPAVFETSEFSCCRDGQTRGTSYCASVGAPLSPAEASLPNRSLYNEKCISACSPHRVYR